MVSDQAARALVPSMCALDDPALGLHDEALGHNHRPEELLRRLPSAGGSIAWVTHDVHGDTVRLLDGLGAFAAIGSVGKQGLEPCDLDAGLSDHGASAVAILHSWRL